MTIMVSNCLECPFRRARSHTRIVCSLTAEGQTVYNGFEKGSTLAEKKDFCPLRQGDIIIKYN